MSYNWQLPPWCALHDWEVGKNLMIKTDFKDMLVLTPFCLVALTLSWRSVSHSPSFCKWQRPLSFWEFLISKIQFRNAELESLILGRTFQPQLKTQHGIFSPDKDWFYQVAQKILIGFNPPFWKLMRKLYGNLRKEKIQNPNNTPKSKIHLSSWIDFVLQWDDFLR